MHARERYAIPPLLFLGGVRGWWLAKWASQQKLLLRPHNPLDLYVIISN